MRHRTISTFSKFLLKSFGMIALISMFSSNLATAETVLFKDPPIIQAAIKGDYQAARSLLLQGIDPNVTGPKNATILIIAAQRRHIDIAEMAIEFGAFVSQFDELGNNALFYAVDNVDYELVEILLDTQISPNHQNTQGESALHWAARVGDIEIIQTLIDAGADAQLRDYTGRDLIDYAQNSRNDRLVQDLERMGISR